MPIQQWLREDRGVKVKRDHDLSLSPYPVDMSPFLLLSPSAYDTTDTQFQVHSGTVTPTPTPLVQYALAHWNQYLISQDEHNRDTFLLQAHWLVAHAVRMSGDASGWPVSLAQANVPTQR